MDGFGARLFAGIDDAIHQKVGFGGGRWADVDGFVGHFNVQSVAIGV